MISCFIFVYKGYFTIFDLFGGGELVARSELASVDGIAHGVLDGRVKGSARDGLNGFPFRESRHG